MADRSLNGGQIVKNLGKSVLEQSGEEYAKGVAGRLAEKSYSPDKQWYSAKDENAVFNPKRDARQLAADAATAALVESAGYAARRLSDGWNGWGRKQREEDHLLSEEEFDTAFERGFNYEEDENLKFIENDAKLKAESGLPKKIPLDNEYLPYTLGPVGEEFKGVVPYGVELTNVYIMAGEGTSTPLRDVKRLYFTYPEYGDAAGWTKKSGTANGKYFHYVIHWYENSGVSPEESFKLKGKK